MRAQALGARRPSFGSKVFTAIWKLPSVYAARANAPDSLIPKRVANAWWLDDPMERRVCIAGMIEQQSRLFCKPADRLDFRPWIPGCVQCSQEGRDDRRYPCCTYLGICWTPLRSGTRHAPGWKSPGRILQVT